MLSVFGLFSLQNANNSRDFSCLNLCLYTEPNTSALISLLLRID